MSYSTEVGADILRHGERRAGARDNTGEAENRNGKNIILTMYNVIYSYLILSCIIILKYSKIRLFTLI